MKKDHSISFVISFLSCLNVSSMVGSFCFNMPYLDPRLCTSATQHHLQDVQIFKTLLRLCSLIPNSVPELAFDANLHRSFTAFEHLGGMTLNQRVQEQLSYPKHAVNPAC